MPQEVIAVVKFSGAHEDGVDNEVAGEDTDAENGKGDVGREHAGLDWIGVEIGGDALAAMRIKRTHDAAGQDSEDEAAERTSYRRFAAVCDRRGSDMTMAKTMSATPANRAWDCLWVIANSFRPCQ